MADKDFTAESSSRSPDTFADLRSASHARHRAQKHFRRSKQRRAPSRLDTTRQSTQQSPTTRTPRPHKCHCNRTKHTWAKALGRKTDAHLTHMQYRQEMERMFGGINVRGDDTWIEDITHREWEGGNWSEWCLQAGATWEDVWGWEPWSEVGETFGAWARRRIGEMRVVKEGRLRAASTTASQTAGSTEVEKATTLPTTPSDIAAHALLDRVLHPPWRRKGDTLPPKIRGFGFFNEYEWYWHRNMSGCFELTSWVAHSSSGWRCYCDVYAGWGRWSPEDRVQPYVLEEFIVDSSKIRGGRCAPRDVGVDVVGEEWDVISKAPGSPLSTSSSWSLLACEE